MQQFHLLGPVDAVQRERVAARQVNLLSTRAQFLHLRRERERNRGEPRGDLEVVNRLTVLEQFEVGHFVRCCGAVEIDRVDRELHLIQQTERHGSAVQRQAGANDDRRRLPFEQRLTIDIDADGQRVVLGLVVEVVER